MADIADVCGVWRLRSCYLEDVETGARTEPFGANPKGVLILLPEGRMAALLTPAEQKPPATEADQANAFRALVAYSGLYRLEPPNRFVTTVDVAWFQPWVGSEQARTFALHGETLDIVSDPARTPVTGDAFGGGCAVVGLRKRCWRSIRPTVLMSEDPFSVGPERGLDIVFRIASLITGRTVADLQEDHVLVGPVDQLVCGSLSRKARAHAGRERHFARLGDQRRLALQDEHELVLLAVPVKERGFTARCQLG